MAEKSSVRYEHARLVLRYAVVSRLLVILMIFLWRSMLNPYDTSASIDPDCLSSSSYADSVSQRVLLPSFASALEDSVVWDGVYFVRIARCGYEYEQSYAFLPLLPICISVFSRTVLMLLISLIGHRAVLAMSGYVINNAIFIIAVLMPLIPIIGHRAVLALAGYVINNAIFIIAALFLYRLSVLILRDPEVALRATILFCFNPASIFYSSIYSESLYAVLSISGLYSFYSGANNLATLLFAVSGVARSNGVLNAGYIGFQTMHLAYNALFIRRRSSVAMQVIISGTLRCLFIFLPFAYFQVYGYWNICHGFSEDNLRPWCKAKLPLLYNYIQSHYWGVGFLRYFQVKQLPNFLLASPVLCLAFCSVIHYIHLWPKVFLSLGFGGSSCRKEFIDPEFDFDFDATKEAKSDCISETKSSSSNQDTGRTSLRKRSSSKDDDDDGKVVSLKLDNTLTSSRPGYLPVTVLPFILHLSFMAATAFLVMHVQVATRFLSASPPLYWFASYIMGSGWSKKKWGYAIWTYCASYIFLGSLLFSNFYPFT